MAGNAADDGSRRQWPTVRTDPESRRRGVLVVYSQVPAIRPPVDLVAAGKVQSRVFHSAATVSFFNLAKRLGPGDAGSPSRQGPLLYSGHRALRGVLG